MKELIKAAIEARSNAYAPYSKFLVGAAVLLDDGNIIKGCNVENASYGLCNCAERTALFSAIANGYKKENIIAMAIAGDTLKPISPCGACRQVICELLDSESTLYLTNLQNDVLEIKVKELLPYGFSDLK